MRLTCSVRFPVGGACDEKQLWLMGSGQVMHCAAMILARLLQLVSFRRSQPVVSGDTYTHSNGRGRGFQTSVAAALLCPGPQSNTGVHDCNPPCAHVP